MVDIQDYFKDIKITIQERVSSPFWAPFFLSWCAINYKVFIVATSSGSSTDKFAVLNKLYPEWWYRTIWWVLIPTLIALFIILALPHGINHLLKWHGELERKLKKTKILNDRDKVIGKKEEIALRRDLKKAEAGAQKEINSLYTELERLKHLNSEIENEQATHHSERDNLLKQIEEQNTKHLNTAESYLREINELKKTVDKGIPAVIVSDDQDSKENSKEVQYIENFLNESDQENRDILYSLYSLPDGAIVEHLAQVGKTTLGDAQRRTKELMAKKTLTVGGFREAKPLYKLTPLGKKISETLHGNF